MEVIRHANLIPLVQVCMPSYIAGRDSIILEADYYISALIQRFPQQSVIYYGLHGVGKTVLLSRIEELAEDRGRGSMDI